ncbi:MAG: sensor histidine kinase, partial [Dehalococcoidia bacterium]|nr:sensor histidine kinase [Dehalococcoidia bacterium]
TSGKPRRLPTEVEDALLRICQEALANIRKHASATAAIVHLDFVKDNVELRIRDDGSGFDAASTHEGSFGLIGMSERARQCGGTTTVTSEKGKGTIVAITIPTSRRRHDE